MRAFLRRKLFAWTLARQGIDRFPVKLVRRRLYVLPTRAGAGFGLLLLAMLVAALNYGSSLALLLTCLLGGLALVAAHQCHRNLLDLALATAWTSPAFAGERGALGLALANDSPLPRFRVEITPSPGGWVSIDLPAHARVRVELPVPARRRGLVRIERIRVSTTHPFGLFRAWTWVHAPLAVTVYPRPRGARPVPEPAGELSGASAAQGLDRDEWKSLRPFREGDSPRQVDWKAYARGAPLLVKEYAASGAARRTFDFDALAGLPTEARLEQLARWVVDAEARGESYGLALPATRLEPRRGAEHFRRALTALALHEMASS